MSVPHRLPGAPIGLLLAALSVGVAWLAVLPPFEGFDETAHYSYVQQLADSGSLPVLNASRISKDVEAYARVFPTRYSDLPPFERNRGQTYRAFFSSIRHHGSAERVPGAAALRAGRGAELAGSAPSALLRSPRAGLSPHAGLGARGPGVRPAVGVARAARRGSDPALRAALVLSACMGSVLFAHVLLRVAITGEGVGTPGWYQHVVAGPMGMALGVGLAEMSRRRAGRVAVAVLAAYTLAYFALVSWIQLSMYAGCATKVGYDKHYAFPEGLGCLWDVAEIWKRVSVIAFPGPGVPLLYLGLAAGGWLLARQLRSAFTPRDIAG